MNDCRSLTLSCALVLFGLGAVSPTAAAARFNDAAAALAAEDAAALAAEDAAALVARGREHLAAGRIQPAREAFESAAKLEPGLATRIWLWRVDIADGQFDRVLSEVSSERRTGAKGPEIPLAVGLALLAKSEAAIATGSTGQVGLYLEDAMANLKEATDAEPERFADAFLPLARAAQLAGNNTTALAAARRAEAADPTSLEARLVRGRAALARSQEVDSDKEESSAALLEEARAAFRGALELIGDPKAPAQQLQAAQALVQVGHSHQFANQAKDADVAYAQALSIAPDAVDLQSLMTIVGAARFADVLKRGAADFTKRYGASDNRDATLQWWLGWALFSSSDAKNYPAAEAAFKTTLAKWPEYVNSWYYLFRLRYEVADWAGAQDALENYAKANLEGLVDTLRRGDEHEFPRVEFVVAKLAGANASTDAAWLSEFLARALPEDDPAAIAAQWNNAGLFWREAGDNRGGRNPKVRADAQKYAELSAMYERSWAAYSSALEIEPDNPAYLNDAAVILHYNLERDYDRALKMYAAAAENAQALLADKSLDPELKPIYELALRDSKNNRRALAAKIEAERKERAGGGAG